MVPFLRISFLLLLSLSPWIITFAQAGVRGEQLLNEDERQRRHLVPMQMGTKQGYSQGRGGASKQQQKQPTIPSRPSTSPSSYSYSFEDVSVSYTTVDSFNWPNDDVWRNDLASRLSNNARLTNNIYINSEREYEAVCDDVSTVQDFRNNGMCVISDNCRFEFCNLDGKEVYNIPAYTLDVRTPNDIVEALNFAETHNIQVSIKTTGHNFAGSSYRKDSLNIFMANYPKDGTIKTDFQDSCGTNIGETIGINGGEVWGDVVQNIQHDYHILSGDTPSVSAAGGWLQGVGLSHTSRMYGLGIDNVVSFDVILPGTKQLVTADACTNSDLFWALRGGGGGTFGVVVHAEYKLLPKTEITTVEFEMHEDSEDDSRAVQLFLEYWARVTPTLDRRVGGAYFRADSFELYILGDANVAREVFTAEFNAWFVNEFRAAGFRGRWFIVNYDSWYDYMGGDDSYENDRMRSGHGRRASTRIVPHDMVVNDAAGIVDFLVDLHADVSWGAYWLGGGVNDVSAGETAVHPAMRSAIWAVSTTSTTGARRVREYLPNSISGCSFNHQGVSEPNWRSSLWGEANYRRLLGIKNRYDPERRLNCWHCVGYQGSEYSSG